MTLTREQVELALPANMKSNATQQLTDKINQIVSDPLVAEDVANNFVSYTSVLQDGRFKIEDYLNAVVYVSFKVMGYNNQEAYARTFPQRYANLVAKNTSSKDISAYVAAYNKGKLVNMILEQTLVPVHVLNQHVRQKAINKLADLMLNANSEKVQSDSASALLTHLAEPKQTGPAVAIQINESDGMAAMKQMMTEMAAKQRELIGQGVPTKEIAAQPLIEQKTEGDKP